MRAVNLLPRDEQRAKVEGARAPLLVLAGGLAAVTAAAVVLGMSASGAAEEQQSQLDAVSASIAALPKPPAQAVSQDTLVQERTNRLAALSAALGARVPFDRVLREISYVLPENAWLTGLRAATTASLAAPAAGAPGGAAPQAAPQDGVTIQGATYSHDAVARVLVRLAAVPSLENVRLTSSARVEQQPEQAGTEKPKGKPKKKQKAVVTFTVSASLRAGGS